MNPEWLPQEEKFRAPCRAYIALIGCHFVSHPPRCAVTVRPVVSHPLTDGVCAFTCRDEQYVVEVTAADAEPLLETESESGGRQIGGQGEDRFIYAGTYLVRLAGCKLAATAAQYHTVSGKRINQFPET